MAITLYHPEVPTCEDCRKWLYDEKRWKRVERWQQTPEGVQRLPVLRAVGTPTPCTRCPKSSPDDPRPRPDRELSDRNQQFLLFYLRCKATGKFPDDPIVAMLSGLIRSIEDAHTRQNDTMLPLLLTTVLRGLPRA